MNEIICLKYMDQKVLILKTQGGHNAQKHHFKRCVSTTAETHFLIQSIFGVKLLAYSPKHHT